MMPRTRAEVLGTIVDEGKVTGQVVSFFMQALVKCTRIYFYRANSALCFLAYFKQCSWRLCSVLQLSSVNLPKARALTSFMKSMT
jgi:hypothetical protein